VVDNSEYHVTEELLSFVDAEAECKLRLRGNLVLVTSPRHYMTLAKTLHLLTGTYWVGGQL